MSKVTDLNPKNEKFYNYLERTKSITSKAAQNIYQDKYFAEEYQLVFISAGALRLVASLVSACTLFIAAYLAFNCLLGLYLSLAIGIAFCAVFEVLKAYVWRISSKQFLKYKHISIAAILVLIGLHLVSLGGSAFGAWHLPTLLIQEQEQQVKVQNLDSIKTAYLAEIATIDTQIKALQDKTSSSTVRRTIKNLTEQRKTTLDAQNLAIQDAKQLNSINRQESKKKALEAKKQQEQTIVQSQVSCLIGAIFFELLFVVCSLFISYYLFRQFIDEDESEQQENIQASNNTILVNQMQEQEQEQGEQAPIQNRVIVQGFKQKEGKRLEANVQKVEYTKICALDSCKKPFIHSIHNQIYCHVDCRKQAYEKRKAKSLK